MNWEYEEGRITGRDDQGRLLAEATFVFRGKGEVDIDHTFVDPSLRGQGVAAQLMTVVAEYLRKNGLKASASCSYANAWLQKNEKAYADIIAQELDSQPLACKLDGKH